MQWISIPRSAEDGRRARGDQSCIGNQHQSGVGAHETLLKREIEAYVSERLRTNHWTKSNAYNSRSILIAMADFVEVREPSRLSSADLQRWYEDLKSRPEKPLTEYSAYAYIRAVRTFLKYLVAERKLRQNVANELKMAKPRKAAKSLFRDRETVERLISTCKREAPSPF